MDNSWNYAYIATVYLGSPAQPIRALFDTGSANAWVISQESVYNDGFTEATSPFNAYDKSLSQTVIEPTA